MYSTDFWQQISGHDVALFRRLSDEHLQAAASMEPSNCEVRIRKGWSHLRHGETEAARVEFEAVLDHLPRDADVIDMCAFGMCHIGLYDAADRLMQRAFFLNPFPPSDYHADYAVLLALRGEAERAEEHFVLSGETGLQYLAVRIANSVAIRAGEERIAPVRERFIENFHRSWQPERPPQVADVLGWFGDTMPLFPADRLAWVRQGLQAMLAPVWPAQRESGS
jgi:tetratricopeptide (TPR) repeat protein